MHFRRFQGKILGRPFGRLKWCRTVQTVTTLEPLASSYHAVHQKNRRQDICVAVNIIIASITVFLPGGYGRYMAGRGGGLHTVTDPPWADLPFNYSINIINIMIPLPLPAAYQFSTINTTVLHIVFRLLIDSINISLVSLSQTGRHWANSSTRPLYNTVQL